MKNEQLRSKYRQRYLTSQLEPLTQLCLMTLFTKINFLFNQAIIKIDVH
jgi:hypothetical protein